ncbi:MAG: tRNA 2-thiocytidine(32) synthetase TtcA [Deltaproteobacteria bacterium]|nr:MAG: tRNA 2-thiocytidine(32) synthetase TtcA [Deltaproteobacteria bacterium]
MEALDRRRRLERLEKALLLDVGRCNKDFGLIEAGDRIMVAVSGGKDSMTLLHLLLELKQRAPIHFEVFALTLDQKQPGFDASELVRWMDRRGIEFHLVEQDTYSIVLDKVPEGKSYCSLCSRLRRGILYGQAQRLGATKIALGHHRDDVIETLLLNLFYAGQIKAMPPRLESDDGRNVVIRPMAYVPEETIAEFAELMAFPILPCNLCGTQDGLKRQRVKALLAELSAENANVKGNLLAALSNVVPSHLFDPRLLG